jgi:hypothetical protein
MKSIFNLKNFKSGSFILTVLIMLMPVYAFSQNGCSVSGKIVDAGTGQSLPYAYISLKNSSEQDSKTRGAVSDMDGLFRITSVQPGVYNLVVTSIGYKKVSRELNVITGEDISLTNIPLQDSIIGIGEAVVTAERGAASLENNRTVFLMNKKILNSSGTAIEALGFIPGIKVDLKKNITLEGGGNILIFVDGVERDRSFVGQLNPSQIDKVEIINAPPSNYDGNASGVINITTKKEENSGISGQFLAELPTSGSEIYLFPSYNISYNAGKFTFYTSYNGEINYENIDESTTREIYSIVDTTRISSNQYVRQKNLSHKFHYGLDFLANSRNTMNFYGYVNPYSYEQDGEAVMTLNGPDNSNWNATREETDHNIGIFNSIFYKRMSADNKKEFTLDVSNYRLNASNTTIFNSNDSGADKGSFINQQEPVQNASVIRADYISPLGENLKMTAGIKARLQLMQDKTIKGFRYNETTLAVYASAVYNLKSNEIYAGLRIEDSGTGMKNSFRKSFLSILPSMYFRRKFTSGQILNLSYNRTVIRPSIYQLNTAVSSDDPLALRTGNPFLEPELRNNLQAEHTIQLHGSILASRLFYTYISGAISNVTFLYDSPKLMTAVYNAGNIHQYGLRFTGSLKFGALTVNPALQFYNISTQVDDKMVSYGVRDRNMPVFESAVSSMLSLKNDLSISLMFQYSTPKNNIQGISYNQALYFLSADKTFKNHFKIGIVSAIPFTRTFIYQGSDIQAPGFSSIYNGNLKLSAFPLWLRLGYQFNSGRSRERISREKEEIISKPKKGL